MSIIKHFAENFISGMDERLDALTSGIRHRLRLNDPIQVFTYRSYGSVQRLYIKGRVLEDKGIQKGKKSDSMLHNLLEMYKRFESDEVPGARLKATFQNKEYFVETDKEGYFVVNLSPEILPDPLALWHKVDLELVDAPIPFDKNISCSAQVMVPPEDAEFGIISDIDDTIIKTDATSMLAMAGNIFLRNAQTRMPFAGVSEFYQALQLGRNGKKNNPFFYVSSSPWNMYDLLVDFMDHNQIPEGTLLLRDLGWRENKFFNSGHMGHKFKEIEQILTTYPHLQFVLIGDSGQEDPAIYREVVKKYPGRILAIYIRDVQLKDREKIAMEISKDMASYQVEMVIVDNTVEAAKHAAALGLVFEEKIEEVIEDKEKDKGEKSGKETLT